MTLACCVFNLKNSSWMGIGSLVRLLLVRLAVGGGFVSLFLGDCVASKSLSDVRGCSVSPASVFGVSVDSMGVRCCCLVSGCSRGGYLSGVRRRCIFSSSSCQVDASRCCALVRFKWRGSQCDVVAIRVF